MIKRMEDSKAEHGSQSTESVKRPINLTQLSGITTINESLDQNDEINNNSVNAVQSNNTQDILMVRDIQNDNLGINDGPDTGIQIQTHEVHNHEPIALNHPVTGHACHQSYVNPNHSNPIPNPLNPTIPVIPVIPRFDEYDTGDILLFSDITYIPSKLIEYFTDSKYSHVGIVLKNPVYIDPGLAGTYILESTGLSDIADSEDNKYKTGVQIRDLQSVYEEYNGAMYWRKLHLTRDDEFNRKIANIHSIIYNKPYDVNPVHWLGSLINVKIGDVQTTNRFFCSALVTYIYDRLGLVDSGTPWDIIRPKDLGTENPGTNRIKFINCQIDNEIVIKKYDLYVHYMYNTY